MEISSLISKINSKFENDSLLLKKTLLFLSPYYNKKITIKANKNKIFTLSISPSKIHFEEGEDKYVNLLLEAETTTWKRILQGKSLLTEEYFKGNVYREFGPGGAICSPLLYFHELDVLFFYGGEYID
ncbi:MAG: hypothetical protein ACXQTP_03275 [Candidatus Methanofastidiosia archaeon]